MWAGDWRRAYDYGDPEGEAMAVHESAGLIDVSTLGKLLVRGSEAGAFLDRLYPNRMSTLKRGRVRYGVLTSDAGRIIDDGTVSRLDDETFYVTTTSSGAGAVEQWFSWWLADWAMDVTITDVTQALSAVEPRRAEGARHSRSADRSSTSRRRRSRTSTRTQARVAGVQCLLLRIGFVGELGYEIHFPAAFGEDLWDALLKAGETEGIRPFGLEPQRILRTAEAAHPRRPGHRLGVDAVRRGDAVGGQARQGGELHRQVGARARRRAAERDRARRVHARGRHGPDRGLGRARLARRPRRPGHERAPLAPARPGDRDGVGADARSRTTARSITIADNGPNLEGSVVTRPFYDPEGALLRS